MLVIGCGYGTASGAQQAAEERRLRTQRLKVDGVEAIGATLADATLVCLPPGDHTVAYLEKVDRRREACSNPCFCVDLNRDSGDNVRAIREWLAGLRSSQTLHVVGPLEVRGRGCHRLVNDLLLELLPDKAGKGLLTA